VEAASLLLPALPPSHPERAPGALALLRSTTAAPLGALAADDPSRHYVIKAWLRLAAAVPVKAFLPFLGSIVGELGRCCEIEVDGYGGDGGGWEDEDGEVGDEGGGVYT
jgi:hypothetical protein